MNNWSKIKYPSYVKPILEWAIKAKKYEELLQFSKTNIERLEKNIEIKKLQRENEKLKKNIKETKEKIIKWAVKGYAIE